MKQLFLITFLLVSVSTAFSQTLTNQQSSVKTEVIETYIKPMYQGGSLETLEKGLPEGFEMFVNYKGEFSKRTKREWLNRLTEVRSRPKKKVTGPKQERTFEFEFIDVTGKTAVAKLKIFYDGKLKFTDYLTLYKIKGDWQIFSKFFTFH